MENIEIGNYLADRGIKPTPNRILVTRQLLKSTHPVSLADIELSLESVDKASIFRVLETLTAHGIVHIIEDGSRSLKYEICHNDSGHTLQDQHVHFYCEKCKETSCFKDIMIPIIQIPPGFEMNAANFVVKGICNKCNLKRPKKSKEEQEGTKGSL